MSVGIACKAAAYKPFTWNRKRSLVSKTSKVRKFKYCQLSVAPLGKDLQLKKAYVLLISNLFIKKIVFWTKS